MRERVASRENFEELLIIRQIRQTFPPSTICTALTSACISFDFFLERAIKY